MEDREITIKVGLDQDKYEDTLEKLAVLKSKIQELLDMQAELEF